MECALGGRRRLSVVLATRTYYVNKLKKQNIILLRQRSQAESTATATSVSVPATGLSAEVKRSYVETNDLPPAPVEVVTRSKILSTAKSYITRDRQADHGDAEDNFSRIAGYWSLHTGTTLTATDVAVMMALLKVARIKQNPQHVDNWVDGAGYFACGGEIAIK